MLDESEFEAVMAALSLDNLATNKIEAECNGPSQPSCSSCGHEECEHYRTRMNSVTQEVFYDCCSQCDCFNLQLPETTEPECSEEEYTRGELMRLQKRFRNMLKKYGEITDIAEDNPYVIFHHRISLYGPPCIQCGRPLRTPRARLCASCMHPSHRARP